MSQITIRNAKSEDFESVNRLIKANPKTIVPRPQSEFHELLNTFWVAEQDKEIVGCVCLELYSPKICEIRTLIVKDEVKGTGIGKELVSTALSEAKKHKIPQILVVTSDPEYFSKLGFGPDLNEKFALFYKGK